MTIFPSEANQARFVKIRIAWVFYNILNCISIWVKKAPDLRKDQGLNFLKNFTEHETLIYSGCQKFVPIICHCEELSDEAIFCKT
jgi:hypothetical protein